MKRKFYKWLLYTLFFLVCSSCSDFLNITPDATLAQEDVFTNISNVQSYFNPVYGAVRRGNPFFMGRWGYKYTFEEITEAAVMGRNGQADYIKNGMMANSVGVFFTDGGGDRSRKIFYENFTAIRICNNVILNIDHIENAINEEDIYDILGQAYFFRGYAYFQLCRLWGGMPYMYEMLKSDDDFDLLRLSAIETYKAVAGDMDLAYENFVKAKKVRRDPKPNETGNLSTAYKLNLPNGCAALALKSRALLYAASPLSNKNNDEQLWRDAAKASWNAIQVALENGYLLLPIENWLDNTYNVKYTNEQLWADANGKLGPSVGEMQTYFTGAVMNNANFAAGICPTQNFVDRYEVAPANGELGYPMNTEEERNKAIADGAYNPQQPYKGLDKRFYHTIFYNDAPTVLTKVKVVGSKTNKINMWYEIKPDGTRFDSEHIHKKGYVSYCLTGYMQKRLTGDLNWTNSTSRELTDPLFMLSELYLNYAEAANEIGGPEGTIEGGITSHDALMIIRERARQGKVRPEYLLNKDVFRERIKNERCVELAFIGHYYYDSYRWMDAPKYRALPSYGIDVERLTGDYDKSQYPDGYRYKRVLLPDNKQTKVWRDEMYYLPFELDLYYQFKNFDTSLNPYW